MPVELSIEIPINIEKLIEINNENHIDIDKYIDKHIRLCVNKRMYTHACIVVNKDDNKY